MSITEQALAILADGRERTATELAERIGIKQNVMRMTLSRAEKAGMVVSDEITNRINGWRIAEVAQ